MDVDNLVPDDTATHTALKSGNWNDTTVWGDKGVPTSAAIVIIPSGLTVTYEENSDEHIFAIRVDGGFIIQQTNQASTTKLVVDTFVGLMGSNIKIIADDVTDGNIEVVFKPFDIMQHRSNQTRIYPLKWSTTAKQFFKDGKPHYLKTYQITTTDDKDRFDNAAEGNLNTSISEYSSTLVDDGAGVYGRNTWDPKMLSLGLITAGEIEILGKEKTNMVMLSGVADSGNNSFSLTTTPIGWNVNDELVITSSGNQSDISSTGIDQVAITNISGTSVTVDQNLQNNHRPNASQGLNSYVGNLSRNITFSSAETEISKRGHFMAMHNPANVQVKYALFKDMGRTDKSRLTDDFIYDKWLDPVVPISKLSSLGQECMQLKQPEPNAVTNPRGRYSIHLHMTGATNGTNAAVVEGNAVWGNPGWAITQHDSHANVSKNVVYDVSGAGIVSEAGNETGFWNDNLLVDIRKARDGKGTAMHPTSGEVTFDADFYHSALFYDDYLFRGEGLAMKGRAVVCKNNVISNANFAVGITNLNPVVNNLRRVDPEALAAVRPGFQIDQFPLEKNVYSAAGDGVMPVEVSLIIENTTVINSYTAMNSIERDMGVNHESRSVFDGFKAWGVNTGFQLTYQMDYSFKDVYISGKNMNAKGIDMWKHSQNHTFENIKLEDLGTGIRVSKVVGTSPDYDKVKTRNNGFTPWLFVNLTENNVTNHYGIELDSNGATYNYTEHCDNIAYLTNTDIHKEREIVFTPFTDASLLNSAYLAANADEALSYHDDLTVDLKVDVTSSADHSLRFSVNGLVSDSGGTYNFGTKQAWAQGDLRYSYPQRIYEFASVDKLKEYLTVNGVYKDAERGDQLYFIINELIPDRFTFEYKSFQIRVDIVNANSTEAPYSSAVYESEVALAPQSKVLSIYGTATQSSTSTNESFESVAIATPADRAIDGNTNGKIHTQFYQKGEVPIGSSAYTQQESEPWWDLDLGQISTVENIDVWGTQELNGASISQDDPDFEDFYVLISDTPFTSTTTLAEAIAHAGTGNYFYSNSPSSRVFSLTNLNKSARYVRVQSAKSNTQLKLAEVIVIGKAVPPASTCGEVEDGGIIINGDFECGYTEDWTHSVSGSAAATFADGTTNSNSGDVSTFIDVTTADGYNKVQLLNTEYVGDLNGKTLTVKAWVKSPTSGAKFKFQIGVNTTASGTIQKTSSPFDLTNTYQEFTYTVDITEETSSILVKINTGNFVGEYYYDDISSTVEDTVSGSKKSLSVDITEGEVFNMYPNPAKGSVYVQGSDKVSKISIYNVSGILVKQINKVGNVIDLFDFNNGIYIVNIEFKDGTKEIKRLLVNN
ncbi:hypothetical protein AXE80_07845 [Wenyingzhuangia fucanilytica]|uniref:Uncharacterized protein n=2 Tax=Wenyingzhuangia fucanilytica TaxID=1790137 RepID=A0A1B1Y633_9FLAO|nr:hypothetical protein AXE80_07845 [Wenyingzhuangia fucanilytica]